jgi:PrtD family type I secretion system ABC transporter
MHFLFDAPWCPLFLIVLVLIDPLLGLVGSVGAVVLFGLAVLNDAVTRHGLSASTEAATQSYAFTESVVRYAEPVRAMGMLPQLGERWLKARRVMMTRQGAASDRNGDLGALIRFCRLLLQGLMLAVGAALAIRGAILPATIFAASVVMGRALAPVEQAVTAWRQIVSALEAARKVQAALHEAPPERRRTRLPPADGGLRTEGLSYTPPGAAQPILEGVDLVVEPGDAVAILGTSGAGKSTLARLITGAVPPTAGSLHIGGVPADRWTRQALARHVGYLPQDVGLFPGTVRDNISRFQNARDREVVAAARRAGVHELILALAEGYETELGEAGAGLSGGQRQRIGLARAVFGPPRLLVLDEPNAHLDQAGEAALARALRELKSRGTTVVVITHRPAALELADRIVVLSSGRIAADGPRTEVLARLQDGRSLAA